MTDLMTPEELWNRLYYVWSHRPAITEFPERELIAEISKYTDAVRVQAIELCAKICENHAYGCSDDATNCHLIDAQSIRALKIPTKSNRGKINMPHKPFKYNFDNMSEIPTLQNWLPGQILIVCKKGWRDMGKVINGILHQEFIVIQHINGEEVRMSEWRRLPSERSEAND